MLWLALSAASGLLEPRAAVAREVPFAAQSVVSAAADSASSVVAAGVDSDGDVDALLASFNDDEVAWYENQGGQFGLATASTAPATILEGQRDDVLVTTVSTLSLTAGRQTVSFADADAGAKGQAPFASPRS